MLRRERAVDPRWAPPRAMGSVDREWSGYLCVMSIVGQRDRHRSPRCRWFARVARQNVVLERHGGLRGSSPRRRWFANAVRQLRRAHVEQRCLGRAST
eukprot:1606788-Pleurochrysis_carterae.AAC.1